MLRNTVALTAVLIVGEVWLLASGLNLFCSAKLTVYFKYHVFSSVVVDLVTRHDGIFTVCVHTLWSSERVLSSSHRGWDRQLWTQVLPLLAADSRQNLLLWRINGVSGLWRTSGHSCEDYIYSKMQKNTTDNVHFEHFWTRELVLSDYILLSRLQDLTRTFS